ncbi:MAG: hypothetical protein ACFFEM_14525 [Candidatus Thorarchaeota archaeon]
MSALEERPLDKLADMIMNILWQDILEVWKAIQTKMDHEGAAAVKSAFEGAVDRFVKGPFSDHLEVRWGMDLCVHCNDNNIEKNGIAYVEPSGDGIEFNQCLNCRIGILYKLVTAKATLDSYNIKLGDIGQFNGMSIYWNAIIPDGMKKFLPTYEFVDSEGQWVGTISFDDSFTPKFLPFEAMTESTPRDSDAPWTSVIPGAVQQAIDEFLAVAKYQVEVALAIK